MYCLQLESSGSRSAVTNTTTFDAVRISNLPAGLPSEGSAFALQIYNTGAEAGGRTLTVSYKTCAHPEADYTTPYGHTAICTDLACDKAAAGTPDDGYRSFSPKTCWGIQFTATYSGALTNGQKFYLIVW